MTLRTRPSTNPTPVPRCPVSARSGVLRAALGRPAQRIPVGFDGESFPHTRHGWRRGRQRHDTMRETGRAVRPVGTRHIGRGAGRFAQELFDTLPARGRKCGPRHLALIEHRIRRLRRRPPRLRPFSG